MQRNRSSSAVGRKLSDLTITESPSTPDIPPSTIGVVIDIDGVLVEPAGVLPGALEAIQKLTFSKIPFVILTNGGGLTEKAHANQLSLRLGIPDIIHEHQFVSSHSPYRDLLPQLAYKNILAIGIRPNKTRELAEAYGFKRVITTAAIMKKFGDTLFAHYSKERRDQFGEDGEDIQHLLLPDGTVQISAVLIWVGPKAYEVDVEMVMYLLLSLKGIIPGLSPKNGNKDLPNNGYLQDEQPKLYFCNMDESWGLSDTPIWSHQVGFRDDLQKFWDAYTDSADLNSAIVRYGKPNEAAFEYAERTLHNWHRRVNGEDVPPIGMTYMIGDDPKTDIKGANNYQSRYESEWKSILVESGQHKEGAEPEYEAGYIVPDVLDAVRLILPFEEDKDN